LNGTWYLDRHPEHSEPWQVANSHMIDETEHDAEHHLTNAQDDGHLHLERVDEEQLVLGQAPDLGSISKRNDEHVSMRTVETLF